MINAFEVVGVQKIQSKKTGGKFIKLNMVSVEPMQSDAAVGCSISEAFIGEGECEIANFNSDNYFELCGAYVRVFKEEVNGLDKITLINVLQLPSATADKKAAAK